MNTELIRRFITFVTARDLHDSVGLAGGIVGTVLGGWDELPENIQGEILDCFKQAGA